ncbi:bifunctional 2-C-methyl-D-erythritol 4-phosphate cytidylyltransferase/2-C-methyl-D-erythritol 2,4-cyclodiphosphate synthase [Lichenihabitans psoromatis]|uniref:bifunctional 2-C-methyl-D-erythritol 4-phosphate cytidylyltransferase/2-C-methyl-D-erythritol 2,4-cyclodiphosphate synthase n=1 Tax=Lichenihabitans psoromatis TaxID=2528642 RepID=UPI00103608C8|nr:bifunctional 2-C-methyl-D-erythritol 4-phosphate cytidylyltransferase/2-C-methyl-D-erythritol 2,4-cyclodiphosphate synthase [Lichenihabitans psoromatis]
MPASSHVLVVAAGRGSRAGAGLPKQFRTLAGQSLIARTLHALLSAHPDLRVTPVIHPDDTDLFSEAARLLDATMRERLHAPVFGGASRQDSVRLGLEALALHDVAPDIVLIHDGARPFVSPELVLRAIAAADRHQAAVPGCAVTDTIKQIGSDGAVLGTLDRQQLRAVQTPQAFAFPLILAAHRQAAQAGRNDLTDDGAVAEYAGHSVYVFEGDVINVKITTPMDFMSAEARLLATLPDIRVGQGYDVHSFTDGDHVWLGGVRIPHDRKLTGHSDADVVLHALTDAVLGAIGDGDIGVHFPPSDEKWRGARSALFLKDAIERVGKRGGVVAHLDVTIVCEAPKIGPHREAMRAAIAEIAGIGIDRVGIKATTSELMGFVGRREGMAAWALATVRLPLGPT